MTAPALVEVAADPFAAVRVLNRMRAAGFALELDGTALVVAPADKLNDVQRTFIRAHKPALVELLQDSAELHAALALAGPAGLGWMEGTPASWDGVRLLAAGEVLYVTRRMVSRDGRRYAREHAPAPPPFREYRPPDSTPQGATEVVAADIPPDIPPDTGPLDPLAARVAELIAAGWSPWNAQARAESEAMHGLEATP